MLPLGRETGTSDTDALVRPADLVSTSDRRASFVVSFVVNIRHNLKSDEVFSGILNLFPGSSGRIRTTDQGLMSPLLYR